MPKKSKPVGADGHRERMRQKLIALGKNGKPLKRDLIEMLLYYPIKVRDTRDSAVLLMQKFNNDAFALLNAPTEELTSVEGIGRSSADFLNLAGEMVRRLRSREDTDSRSQLHTSEDIKNYFREIYTFPEEDELWVLFLDNANHPLELKLKSGVIEMYPDDIYMLLHNATIRHSCSVAIAHMVPPGGTYSSALDTMICEFTVDYLEGAAFTLCDYYIITEDDEIRITSQYI